MIGDLEAFAAMVLLPLSAIAAAIVIAIIIMVSLAVLVDHLGG